MSVPDRSMRNQALGISICADYRRFGPIVKIFVCKDFVKWEGWCTRQGSNLRPSDSKSDALSN